MHVAQRLLAEAGADVEHGADRRGPVERGHAPQQESAVLVGGQGESVTRLDDTSVTCRPVAPPDQRSRLVVAAPHRAVDVGSDGVEATAADERREHGVVVPARRTHPGDVAVWTDERPAFAISDERVLPQHLRWELRRHVGHVASSGHGSRCPPHRPARSALTRLAGSAADSSLPGYGVVRCSRGGDPSGDRAVDGHPQVLSVDPRALAGRHVARRSLGSRDRVKVPVATAASNGTPSTTRRPCCQGIGKGTPPCALMTAHAGMSPAVTPSTAPSVATVAAWPAANRRRNRGPAPTAASVTRSGRLSAAESAVAIAVAPSVTNAAAAVSASRP